MTLRGWLLVIIICFLMVLLQQQKAKQEAAETLNLSLRKPYTA
jgi:preprotein translocase subunit YajC